MKRILLFLLLGICIINYAQEVRTENKEIRYGVAAGVNRSEVSNVHHPSGARYGFQAGALVLIPVGNSNRYFIEPEVLYHQAGEIGKDKDYKGLSGYNALYANDYLSIPVYFKMYFSKKSSSFFAMAGPRFNFLINQKVEDYPENRPWYDPDYNGINGLNGKAAKMNFAIGLGLGYSLNREWEFVIKHDIGLTNTYKGLIRELSFRNKSEQVISLGANYIF